MSGARFSAKKQGYFGFSQIVLKKKWPSKIMHIMLNTNSFNIEATVFCSKKSHFSDKKTCIIQKGMYLCSPKDIPDACRRCLKVLLNETKIITQSGVDRTKHNKNP
jgi:hypothetical protein